MPESIVNFVNTATGIIWGPGMLFLLVGGGLFISFRIGFAQVRHFRYMFSQTFGSLFKKNNSKGEGTITPFQAVTSELASTVGAANIVGVPVAIFFGGPGAVFWMWMTALVGMGTKFAEIVLGIMYREKNEKGDYVSGPMYYLRNGLKSPSLANIYSFLFMITILCGIMVQANSAAGSAVTLGISPTISGIVITLFVGLIVVGGITRIGKISEKFVPFMAGFYILGCLFIILGNLGTVPTVFALIMKDAFTGHAAVGGFAGSTIVMAMRFGTARGAYSNEAGMGSAPIAHAASQTDHPVRQGLWGMFSVFMDTIVICSMTAFVVLASGVWQETGIEASAMTAVAFTNFYGPTGGFLVSIAVLLFVISTIYVILYFGETIANYLFGYKFSIFMRFVYLAACFIGAIGGMKFLWLFLDLLFGLAVIPNMIGLILLSGVVASQTKEFFTSDEFYLKDIAVNKKNKNLKA
ncbi:MAG: sodium:alanine symporter family protein [Clostridium sp.]